MNRLIDPPTTRWTVAELLDRLGVPPDRVRLHPWPGTATEQDILDIEGREDRLCELIDGVLVEKPVGFYESLLASHLGYLLEGFVLAGDLGIVVGEAGMMRLWPGRVRIPDVAFLSWERLPGGVVPREPIPDVAPDLAVEVLSNSNTEREMQEKLRDYFRAGTRLVWLIDPESRTARAIDGPERAEVIDESGTLDGRGVLPGFRVPLRTLFERAERRGPGPA